MEMNFLVIALAALVPMLIGFIWYNPKVLGTAWMEASGVTPEMAKGANMTLIFGLSFLFSFMMAFATQFQVIHQYHVFSIFADNPDALNPATEVGTYYKNFMDTYGTRFRTFGHGAFHGLLFGIFMVLPIIGINALFERKGFKYIAINVGYFTLSFILMGGIICQWA